MNFFLRKRTPLIWCLSWLILLVCCTPPESTQGNISLAANMSYPVRTAIFPPITSIISPTLTPYSISTLEVVKAPTQAAQTSTPIPTSTKPTFTLTPSSTLTTFIGPLIAFDAINSESEEGVILIIDTATGIGREIANKESGNVIAGFDWSQSGCELFIAVQESNGVHFEAVDLAGNVNELLSRSIPYSMKEGLRYSWTISPTKEWISFLLAYGEDEDGFVFFKYADTWIIGNTMESDTPISLTQNSWTFEPVWSPGGDRLAYTVHDSAGIPQLFHSAPNGSDQIQLTQFTEPIDHIQGIRWSPNGRWLSFATYQNADALASGESFLWSVARDGHNLNRVELGDFVIRQSPWWSSDSDSYTAYVELWAEEASRGFQEGKIVWVNPQDGTITHEFMPNEIQFEHVFPVGGNEVIGFLGTEYVIYDKAEEIVQTIGDSPFELVYPREISPLIGPYDFKGEENCN